MDTFKICPKCDYRWKTRDEFIQDGSLRLIGYQAAVKDVGKGLYLFNHILENQRCNTTLAVEVRAFISLYDGPEYEEFLVESEECEGHCGTVEDLASCDAPCRNAVARRIMLDVFNTAPSR